MKSVSVFRGLLPVLAAFAFLAFNAGSAHAQGVGAIQGRVVNSQTQEPLQSAQVYIPGTKFGVLSDAQGRYALPNVPSGRRTVRVELIGYASAEQVVTVTAGAAAAANFAIRPSVLKVDAVVATGLVAAMPQTKAPFSVAKLDNAQMPVKAPSIDGMLQGKVAGASIVNGDGTPGSNASIVLRGVKSLNASGRSQEPLYIVDGVITQAGLQDINALDVENVEIVKGAAAASLYGSRAANGVVSITTKRGTQLHSNTAHYTFRSEYGNSDLPRTIQLSFNHPYKMNADHTMFVDNAGHQFTWNDTTYSLVLDASKTGNVYTAFQDKPFPGPNINQADKFFNPGGYLQNYMAVEGRRGTTNYYVSFNQMNEQGIVYSADGYQRQNFRLNLDHGLSESLQLSASSFYSHAKRDNANGDLFALTFAVPTVDLLAHVGDSTDPLKIVPYLDPRNSEESNPLYSAINEDDHTQSDRFMGAVGVKYSPIDWFNLEANLSYDKGTNVRTRYYPKGYVTRTASSLIKGNMYKNTDGNDAMNGGLTASATKQYGDLTVRARARYAYETQSGDYYEANGNDLAVKGLPVLSAVQGNKTVYSSKYDIRSEGYFLIGGLDYKDRYVLDGLVRRDGSSLFGPESRWATYYRGSAAWRISKEPFYTLGGAIPELKLRASLGTAGNRPSFAAQYETYSIAGGSPSPDVLGNRALKPELAKELEVGADALFFNRVTLNASYVKTTVDDQILRVPLPGYAGFSAQWRNAGALSGKTWEATLETELVRTKNFVWSARGIFDRTKSTITRLDVPPYQYGYGQNGNQFYNREGEEVGTFYGHKFAHSCADLPTGMDCSQFQVNDDGFLVFVGTGNTFKDGMTKSLWGTTASVPTGTGTTTKTYQWGVPFLGVLPDNTTFQRLGNTLPKFNFALGNTVTFRGLSLYGLLETSRGFQIYNQTRQWAFRENRGGAQDQAGKADELKKPIGYYTALYDVNSVNDYFTEDGSYVKLRELSLRYTFDKDALKKLRMGAFSSVTANLSGRNLHTWTKFQGYDPEVGAGGGQAGSEAIARFDNYQYPNFRTLTASLEVVF